VVTARVGVLTALSWWLQGTESVLRWLGRVI
jgi:hypothetical protein